MPGHWFGNSAGVLGYHVDETTGTADCVPSPQWRGALPGYYYGAAENGVGYYRYTPVRCNPSPLAENHLKCPHEHNL